VPNPGGPTAPVEILGLRIRTYDLVVLAIAAAATALLVFFLQRTKRGAAMQAVAMDHEAATAVGIHVGRSNAVAFMLGAALAALAGGLVGPLLYVSPAMGGSLGIKGFRGRDPRRVRQHSRRHRRRPRDRCPRRLRRRALPGLLGARARSSSSP
jgi:branched-chain amino acid transport system permease protein